MPADVRKQQEQDPLESLLSILSGVVTVGDAVIERTSSTPESSRSLSDSGSTETRNSLANPQSQGSSSNSMARTPFSLVMHLLNPEEPKRIISNLAKGLFPKGGPQYKEGMTGKEMAAEGVRTFENSTLLGMGALRGVPSDMTMRGLNELHGALFKARASIKGLVDSRIIRSGPEEKAFGRAINDIEGHLKDPKVKALTETIRSLQNKYDKVYMKLGTLHAEDVQKFDLIPQDKIDKMLGDLEFPLSRAKDKLDDLILAKGYKGVAKVRADVAARDAEIKAITRNLQEQKMGKNVKILPTEKNVDKLPPEGTVVRDFEAIWEAQASRAQQIDELEKELERVQKLKLVDTEIEGARMLSEKEIRLREAIHQIQMDSLDAFKALQMAADKAPKGTRAPVLNLLDKLGKGPKGGKPKK